MSKKPLLGSMLLVLQMVTMTMADSEMVETDYLGRFSIRMTRPRQHPDRKRVENNKLAKLGDAIDISKSETITD